MISSGYASDKGKMRDVNEDACLVLPHEQVYAVADGVGGSSSGDYASRMAVTCVADFMRRGGVMNAGGEEELAAALTECVNEANRSIFSAAKEFEDCRGMATTLVLCHVRDGKAYFVNVGDSRAYMIREGRIIQVTEDHTYVNTLVKLGVLTRDEAKEHERANIITRAVGVEEEISADFYSTDVMKDDVIILCTDGLHKEIPDELILDLAGTRPDMKVLADDLVSAANGAGGRDNITVVCLKV